MIAPLTPTLTRPLHAPAPLIALFSGPDRAQLSLTRTPSPPMDWFTPNSPHSLIPNALPPSLIDLDAHQEHILQPLPHYVRGERLTLSYTPVPPKTNKKIVTFAVIYIKEFGKYCPDPDPDFLVPSTPR